MQKFFLQFFALAFLLISSSYATNDCVKPSLSQARSSQILENLIILEKSGVDLSVYGQPVWFQAAKFGFTDVISFLMHKYIKIDEVEEKGKTALHFASEMGQVQTVDLLLREGAFIDKKIKYASTTPLKLAAYNGHNETVKKLLEYNVNKNENITAMHLATMGGHITIIKTLLDAGFDVNGTEWPNNSTALHTAALYGQLESLKILIENGAELDSYCNEWTPIKLAAVNGHSALVQALLLAGAKIDSVHKAAFCGDLAVLKSFICLNPKFIHYSENYMNALHFAALSGEAEIVKFLLNNGVEFDGLYTNTISPLHLAIKNGHMHVIKILIEAGAKINGTYTAGGLNANLNQISAIFLAGGNGNLNLINFLIKNGVNINEPNRCDLFLNTDLDHFCYITALHHAAYKGHLEAVCALINAGAEINAIDYNWSPLHQAAEKGHVDIVLALVEAGANINVAEKFHQWTPLHLAAKNGHFETVQLLVSLGANYIIKNKYGYNSAMLAGENGHFLIEEFLLNCKEIEVKG